MSRESDKQRLIRELMSRQAATEPLDALRASLFSQQLAFVDDRSQEITAVCSRRAGKTHAAVGKLIINSKEYPGSSGIYGALTRQSAKRIAWKVLKQFNQQFGLNAKFNNTDLTVEFPWGSDLRLIGLNDPDAAETIRGEKLFGAVLDEAQSYGSHIQYFLEEVLDPTLIDLNGWKALIGTPNAACTGPFFEASAKKDSPYSKHHWTLLQNPHIPHAAAWLDNYRKKKRWSLDNPIYQREWCGLWIKSTSSLVYRFTESNVAAFEKAGREWNYIMGVDLGYEDASAIVVLAYSFQSPTVHVVDTFKRTRMLPSELAVKIREYEEKWHPTSIVADTGGLGKAIVEEMRKRYGLTIRAAEKKNKYEYIELINSDFVEKQILIDPSLTELGSELSLLQWDEDRRKEDPRYENHLADAMLYAWREAGHWGYRAEEKAPEYGSTQWQDAHEKELAERLEKAEQSPWWEK